MSENGRVFTWGNNYVGQLGNGFKNNCKTPRLEKGKLVKKKVAQVACGPSNTLVLTDQGQVFSWGQLWGTEPTIFSILPHGVTEAIGDRKAVSIACTSNSSHVLLEDGQLYAWGENEDGRLGIGNTIK